MISVVIPAFNEERYIGDCLKSLNAQDYNGGYEILVIDNSSTDNTANIASRYGARVILCTQMGTIHARQQGAAEAGGDIIVQADADTVYPVDWLSRIAGYFSGDDKICAVAGFFHYKDPPRWAWLEYAIRKAINEFLGIPFFKRPLMVSGANFAFRRSSFLEVGGYDAHSFYPDQYGISTALSRMGTIKYAPSLIACTSRRRVNKPFIYVALETIRNTGKIIKYVTANRWKSISLKSTGARSRHTRLLAAAIVLAAVLGFFIYGYAVPSSQAFGQVYFQSKTQEKVVALTFDDGPNEPYTSQILDLLRSHNVKATFFVIGKNVELFPDVAKRIYGDGHVIGNHSYIHNANHALVNDGGAELRKAQQAIRNTIGVEPHLYRPPHGKKSPWESSSLQELNLVNVTWSNSVNEIHDVLVFGKPRSERMSRTIIDQIKPGDIILLHDGYGIDHNTLESNKECTVRIISVILEKLQSEGYRFVTVAEMFGLQPYN